ncbi:putative ATP-dependent RNA helicase TDRD12 [Fopius arisanus]|uniref:RNA helicase n=1 Tax=Fopius arisanus TaxID=64838 RepID=A0A9R1TP92_9HYME|nr:PREDICTED: putative ATP-dependent RNA helicase TDRD12 [Fopius arisanus]
MDPPMLRRQANLPKILWHQDHVKVVLRILLAGVKNYFVKVDIDHIQFSTYHDGREYYVILYFFGAIVPEKTINENLGREIRVQVIKAHKHYNWLRLERGKEKIFQIISDPEKIEAESFCTVWNDCKNTKELNIYPDVPSSNDDDSDDERYHLIEDY